MTLRGPEYLLNSRQKRGLDVLSATLLAGALLPSAVLAGIAAAIDNRELYPLFRQHRIGPDDTLFEVIKFRTIRRQLSQAGYEHFGVFDPRASFIGQTLRRYGIDEYPQIFQILAGTMSMVGPRPLPKPNMQRMEAAEPDIYKRWRPQAYDLGVYGLTSPSTIYRHNHGGGVDIDETIGPSMELDILYCQEEASLKRDLQVMSQTPLSILKVAAMSAKERLADLHSRS